MLIKNTASQYFYVFAFDLGTNGPKTGDAANISAQISKDGGAFAATNDAAPDEVGLGWYRFAATQAETNADDIIIVPSSTTANIQLSPVFERTINVSTIQSGLATSTALQTVDDNVDTLVSRVPDTISLANINGQVDQALIDIGLDHLVSASVVGADVTDNSIIAKLVSKSATADWDTYVNTTDSLEANRDNTGTAGAGLTAIDLPDQTMNITGNITGNLSGSVGSVTGAVGSVTGNVGGNVTGSIGSLATQAKADVQTEAEEALQTYNLDHLVKSAVDTNFDTTVHVDSVVGQLASTSDGGYSRATDSLEALRDNTGTAGAGLTAIDLPDQTMNITGNITGSLSGSVGSVTGAVGSVTGNVGGNVTGSIGSLATQAKADVQAEAEEALQTYNLDHLVKSAVDTDFDTTVHVNSVIGHMSSTSDGGYSRATDSLEALRDNTGTAGAGLTAIDLPDQTMNITGNITGNLSGSVGSVTGAVGSVTGNVGGNVTGSIGSLATQAKADVQAEAEEALQTYNLDHLVKSAVDTDFATTVHLNSVLGHLADNGTSATFDRTTDSLEALRDNTGTAGAGLTAIDLPDQTMNITGNITGNLSGSVGSVSGAVGSVTGNVGGNVNGNVVGSIGSLATQAKADVNAEADTALSDAGVTTTRTGYLDKLNISGNVASSTEVTSIQNNTRVVRTVPDFIERPDSGTATYRIELFLYDSVGNMEVPDSAPTLNIVDESGNSRDSRLDSTTMALVSTGRYRAIYTADAADGLEQLNFLFAVVEGGATRVYGNTTQVVDTTAADFTTADRAMLVELHDNRLTAQRAANLDNLDGAISDLQLDLEGRFDDVDTAVAAVQTTANTINSKTTNLPSDPADQSILAGLISGVETKVDILDTNVDTLVARVPDTLSLANIRTQADNALAAINLDHLLSAAVDTDFATTVHLNSVLGHLADNGTSATFDRSTDSLEALRDNTGTAGAGLTAIDLPDQTMNITGNITGNLSGSVGSVTGAVGSVTGNVGGNVVGSIGSLATQAKADVQAEAEDALRTYNLDHLLSAAVDTNFDTTVHVDSVIGQLASTSDGGYSRATDSLEALRDNTGTAGAGLTAIDLPDQTMNITGNITGNLSGSVGSVTGNVGGNVAGSVGSLATQAKAEVNAEVDTALTDIKLDLLIANAVPASFGASVHDNSIIGYMTATSDTATFDRTNHSLEAIEQAGGGLSAADVWSYATRTLSAATNITSTGSPVQLHSDNKVLLAGTTHTSAVVPSVTTVVTTTNVTNDVGITQAGADKVWGTTSRTLSAATNITSTGAAIQLHSDNKVLLAGTTHTSAVIPNVTLVGTTTTVTNDVGITQTGADRVWSSAARTLTAFGFTTGLATAASLATVDANVTTLLARVPTTLSSSNITSWVDTALAGMHLDHLLAVDTGASLPGVSGSVFHDLLQDNGSGTWQFTEIALEMAPAGGGGGGGGDWSATEKAQIRYQLGIDGTATAPAVNVPHLAADFNTLVPGDYAEGTAGWALGQVVTITGDGPVTVTHDYGGEDNYRVLKPDMSPVENAFVRLYSREDYLANRVGRNYVVGETTTRSDGRWRTPVFMDPGSYTMLVYKSGEIETSAIDLLVAEE